jgi:hypothetical protein
MLGKLTVSPRRERRDIPNEGLPELVKGLTKNEIVELILEVVDESVLPTLFFREATAKSIYEVGVARGSKFDRYPMELIEAYLVILVDNYVLDRMERVPAHPTDEYEYVRYLCSRS